MATVFRTASDADAADIRLLRYLDRAVLRILDRAEAATPRQLAILAYGNLRTAQERLALLWRAGLLERTTVPPPRRGGAELAYRLSRRAQRRLGDTSRRTRGSNRLGHTLDIVETVCALVTAHGDPRTSSPVQVWLTEATARSHLGGPPYPDSVVVLAEGERSVVLCLEIDRATQRLAAIAAKLASYRRLLAAYPDWPLLFVVPTANRARWLRHMASATDEGVAANAWVTSLVALRSRHMQAAIVGLGATSVRATVGDLQNPAAPRRSATPVGSEAWLRLLGEGGVEDLDGILW
jgi:hypothetical protein